MTMARWQEILKENGVLFTCISKHQVITLEGCDGLRKIITRIPGCCYQVELVENFGTPERNTIRETQFDSVYQMLGI